MRRRKKKNIIAPPGLRYYHSSGQTVIMDLDHLKVHPIGFPKAAILPTSISFEMKGEIEMYGSLIELLRKSESPIVWVPREVKFCDINKIFVEHHGNYNRELKNCYFLDHNYKDR